jgi:hypothetical protein
LAELESEALLIVREGIEGNGEGGCEESLIYGAGRNKYERKLNKWPNKSCYEIAFPGRQQS